MYKTREESAHEAINNQSLITCARIAELVKQPQCIPYYEAYTYGLVARYFSLTEKRVHNAYVSHRYMFENDSSMVSGHKLLNHVREVKNLGKSYGYLCEYSNGVVVQLAYTANMLFNSRALLNFAVILKDESDVARKIFDVLDGKKFLGYGALKRKTPWYVDFNGEPVATENVDSSTSVICPYHAEIAVGNKLYDPKPVKMQNKKNSSAKGKTRKINQLDRDGNIIYVWNSLSEASNTLGVDIAGIYRCCMGKQKTVGAERKGMEGKYRFSYAN